MVIEAHAHVVVAALLDQPVGPDLALQPLQLVAIGDLLHHLGERVGHPLIGESAAGAEGDLHAAVELMADGDVQRREHHVQLQHRLAGGVEPGAIGVLPLPAARAPGRGVRLLAEVEALAARGLGDVLAVAAIAGVLVARPGVLRETVAHGLRRSAPYALIGEPALRARRRSRQLSRATRRVFGRTG